MIEFARDEGAPESFGGNSFPAKRLIRSEKWQTIIKEAFGESVFNKIMSEAQKAALIN